MMSEFPRFTREQNRACKLTDEKIAMIPKLHKKGFSQRQIAKMFNVGKTTIARWLMTSKERKTLYQKQHSKDKNNLDRLEKRNIASIKARKRKQILLKEEMREWWRYRSKLWAEKYPNYAKEHRNKEQRREYYLNIKKSSHNTD